MPRMVVTTVYVSPEEHLREMLVHTVTWMGRLLMFGEHEPSLLPLHVHACTKLLDCQTEPPHCVLFTLLGFVNHYSAAIS